MAQPRHKFKEDILCAYTRGVPLKEISVLYGISKGHITRMVRRCGLSVRRVSRKPLVVDMAQKGMSIREICIDLNCSRKYVVTLNRELELGLSDGKHRDEPSAKMDAEGLVEDAIAIRELRLRTGAPCQSFVMG